MLFHYLFSVFLRAKKQKNMPHGTLWRSLRWCLEMSEGLGRSLGPPGSLVYKFFRLEKVPPKITLSEKIVFLIRFRPSDPSASILH